MTGKIARYFRSLLPAGGLVLVYILPSAGSLLKILFTKNLCFLAYGTDSSKYDNYSGEFLTYDPGTATRTLLELMPEIDLVSTYRVTTLLGKCLPLT